MVKLPKLNTKNLLIGGAIGLGGLFLAHRLFTSHPTMGPSNKATKYGLDYDDFSVAEGDASRAYTAMWDIGPLSGWNGLNSEVWGFRDRKDRNDCLLDNRMPPYDLTAISDYKWSNPPIAGSRDFDVKEGGYSPLYWTQTTRTRC